MRPALTGLKLPMHSTFGEFGGIFPTDDVTHRRDPQKDRPWTETRRVIQHKNQCNGSSWERDREKRKI